MTKNGRQRGRQHGDRCIALCAMIAIANVSFLHAGEPPTSTNLALGRPAVSSSIENDEHSASRANDGNRDTCWTADDEPEGEPDWWQVDLGNALTLSSIEIVWPFDGMNYRCKVEGSADRKQWQLLSDQTQTKSRARLQQLSFGQTPPVRYVRITITGFDAGCCAGISEVKVFGSRSTGS